MALSIASFLTWTLVPCFADFVSVWMIRFRESTMDTRSISWRSLLMRHCSNWSREGFPPNLDCFVSLLISRSAAMPRTSRIHFWMKINIFTLQLSTKRGRKASLSCILHLIVFTSFGLNLSPSLAKFQSGPLCRLWNVSAFSPDNICLEIWHVKDIVENGNLKISCFLCLSDLEYSLKCVKKEECRPS